MPMDSEIKQYTIIVNGATSQYVFNFEGVLLEDTGDEKVFRKSFARPLVSVSTNVLASANETNALFDKKTILRFPKDKILAILY